MTQILLSAAIALAVSILLTPAVISWFAKQGFGQEIRVDGPESHKAKRGTPPWAASPSSSACGPDTLAHT